MIILIIFLILTVLSILVCCFVAGSTPYDREADDEAQLEFLRKYRESRNRYTSLSTAKFHTSYSSAVCPAFLSYQ